MSCARKLKKDVYYLDNRKMTTGLDILGFLGFLKALFTLVNNRK